MPTFARATDGELSGYQDSGPNWKLKVSTAEVERRNRVPNVTKEGDSAARFAYGKRLRYNVEGQAWLYDGSDNLIHLTDNAGSVSGSVFGRTSGAVLEKNYGEPVDVTSAGDTATQTEWAVGFPIYSGGARGFLQPSDTLIDESFDPNATPNHLILPLGGSYTIESDIIIGLLAAEPSFRGGGPIPASFQYRFDGAPTESSGGTPFEQETFSATLDLDLGTKMTGSLLIHRLRVDLDYRKGGPVPFEFTGVFTGDVSFS